MMSRRCRDKLTLGACQLLLTLKAYEQDHGSLPVTLDELVPRYLKQVPTDAFDGKPIRYSAERRILYSVGEDLRDDGGSELDRYNGRIVKDAKSRRWNGKDVVFRLDF